MLGDRIRMQTHTLDPDVFIRSMATRGSLGGLAAATGDIIKLMDAAGFLDPHRDGRRGQTELDIIKRRTRRRRARAGVGRLRPGMKAGLMEVADIFAVNKADRAGAHALMAELRFCRAPALREQLSPKDIDWEIPVLAAQATNDVGIAELLAEVKRHRSVLEADGRAGEAPPRAPSRGAAGAPRRRVRGRVMTSVERTRSWSPTWTRWP